MVEALAEIRTALLDVSARLVPLVRSAHDTDVPAVGSWTVGDVAAHLSHGFRADADAIAGRPVPEAVVTKAGIAEAAAKLLREDGERDPAALADRIRTRAGEFDDVVSRSRSSSVTWLQDLRIPTSMAAGHLLNECLIHGHDIATALGRPWPIQRHHALLALENFVFPLIATLPPTALMKQEGSGGGVGKAGRAGTFRARIEVRLRGGGSTLMVIDRGSLTLDTGSARDVDAHLWADPAAFMLVLIGRQKVVKPMLEGKLVAWGVRPWKLARMLTVISPP